MGGTGSLLSKFESTSTRSRPTVTTTMMISRSFVMNDDDHTFATVLVLVLVQERVVLVKYCRATRLMALQL